MLLQISHRTRFVYDQPAHDSHNELRLRPLDAAGQRCLSFELSIDQPASVITYRDFFGNHAHSVSVSAPHRELTIVAHSLVERPDTLAEPGPEMTFRDFLRDDEVHLRDYWEYLNPSHYVPFSERLQKLFWMARPGDTEDVGCYVARIVAWVRDQFDYQKARTHVHSSVDDILKTGSGVCQDFAHLTIGLLRLAGVPVRYVSGYLAPTLASAGAASLGEQASHAWIETWLPRSGWTGFDPTHRYRTDERHVRVAVGRDYADVPPLKGMYRSNAASQIMTVDLNVEHTVATGPLDETGIGVVRASDADRGGAPPGSQAQ
ncbi:MAG TPA: transglutaminase family protein [Candidatus Binataceae bacterium]|nr:transglutaminase family protein [Candidatus Binataceae bacterium]